MDGVLVWHVRRGPKVLKCSELFKYYVGRLKIKKELINTPAKLGSVILNVKITQPSSAPACLKLFSGDNI